METAAVVLTALTRALSVSSMIIPDCDEVFNYWEPLNFLTRGFGKQTWEYSPEYSIRSWAYLLPYHILLSPFLTVYDVLKLRPYVAFYIVRAILGGLVFIGEIRLYFSLRKNVSDKVAKWFLFFSGVSTGMTHGSVALLPLSFALMGHLYALSEVLNYYTSKHIQSAWIAVAWYTLSGLLGWPFALVLATPALLYVISTLQPALAINFLGGCALIFISLGGCIVAYDLLLYQKLSLVPLNIVLYNVLFADEESGPNIFGTEPFSYYFLNLALNFNVIAVLAFLGVAFSPLLAFFNAHFARQIKESDPKYLSPVARLTPSLVALLMAPFVLWFAIFSSQPHKEERFLYPIYPTISLSAAIFMANVNSFISQSNYSVNLKIVSSFHRLFNIGLVTIVSALSVLRTLQLVMDYSAPLDVYKHIPEDAEGSICVGREWYRYPSSFFLPENARLRFVESGFKGLLPGDFPEGQDLVQAISSYPAGMNNKNNYDAGKVIPFDNCDYYIDIDESVDSEAGERPVFSEKKVVDPFNWELVYCGKFIDNTRSYGIGRILYIPEMFHGALKTKVVYHGYCLAKKVGEKVGEEVSEKVIE